MTKEEKKIYSKRYREKNKEYYREYYKIWYSKAKNDPVFKETKRKRDEEYCNMYPDKVKKSKKIYKQKNREKINKQRKQRRKERKNDPVYVDNLRLYNRNYSRKRRNNLLFRIQANLRSRLCKAIETNVKSGSSIKDLGCNIPEFKLYIEKLFKPDMSWENYGKNGWHLDHIKPLSGFDLTNREQFLKACHYTNIQPLWAEENMKKGNKILFEKEAV